MNANRKDAPFGIGRRPASGGFGMVELMLALVLGLVIMAAMGQLYSGTRQTNRVSEALAGLNEKGRFAVDFLSADLRMAGYLSCGGPGRGFTNLRSTLNIANATHGEEWLYEIDRAEGFAVRGFEGSVPASVDGFDDMLDGTDAIIIRRAMPDPEHPVAVQSATATSFDLTSSDHGFQTGEILVVASPSCDQTSVFQVTGTDTDSVTHSDGLSLRPGNCTSDLFGDLDCSGTSSNNSVHEPTSSVTRFAVHAYYVRDSDPPTLMRVSLSYPGDPAAETGNPYVKDVILPDVENLQVLYGVETGADDTLIVDDYLTADEIDASTTVHWRDVLSVRFALLVRSRENNVRGDDAGQSFDLRDMLDTPYAPSDRHVRKTFGSVVALRNSIP